MYTLKISYAKGSKKAAYLFIHGSVSVSNPMGSWMYLKNDIQEGSKFDHVQGGRDLCMEPPPTLLNS